MSETYKTSKWTVEGVLVVRGQYGSVLIDSRSGNGSDYLNITPNIAKI